jgi:hypothetical protein
LDVAASISWADGRSSGALMTPTRDGKGDPPSASRAAMVHSVPRIRALRSARDWMVRVIRWSVMWERLQRWQEAELVPVLVGPAIGRRPVFRHWCRFRTRWGVVQTAAGCTLGALWGVWWCPLRRAGTGWSKGQGLGSDSRLHKSTGQPSSRAGAI